MPTVPLTYHRADISGGGWLRKLETNPSRFYVGKFVPEVPAPGATFAGHENHQKQTVRLLPRIMIASREVTCERPL